MTTWHQKGLRFRELPSQLVLLCTEHVVYEQHVPRSAGFFFFRWWRCSCIVCFSSQQNRDLFNRHLSNTLHIRGAKGTVHVCHTLLRHITLKVIPRFFQRSENMHAESRKQHTQTSCLRFFLVQNHLNVNRYLDGHFALVHAPEGQQ